MKTVKRWFALLVVLVMVAGVGIPPFGNVWVANAENTGEQATTTTTAPANEEPKDETQADMLSRTSEGQTAESTGNNAAGTESPAEALPSGGDIEVKSVRPEENQRQIQVTFKKDNNVVDEQMVVIKAGQLTSDLQIPKTPDGDDNQKFQGWFDEQNNKLIRPSEDLNGFLAAVGSDDEITYTAKYSEVYYAYFMSSDSEDAHIVYTATTDRKDGEVSMYSDYHPNNARVDTWKNKETNETYKPGRTVSINKDTVFVPVVIDCYWVTFNTQGGGDIESQYVDKGDVCDLTKLPKLTKKGYTFNGWSTTLNGATVGNTFRPEKDTILYAQWKPAETEYTVVFWGENADDEEYSVLATETKRGTTGTEIALNKTTGRLPNSVTDRAHFYFEKSDKRFIAADGSSVINVYYKRNTYTIKFIDGSETIHTVTAKYDSDISKVWQTDPVKSRLDAGKVFQSSVTNKYYSFLQKMPNQNITMTAKQWHGTTYTWGYYLEVLNNNPPAGATVIKENGKSYYLYHTVAIKGVAIVLTYDEDYFPITGFRQRDNKVPNFEWNKKMKRYEAKLFYERESYSLKFLNYNEKKEESVPYEASIANKGTTPARPAGVPANAEFKGWYQVPPEQVTDATQPYDFSGKTMPAKNLVFYACWQQKPFTVHLAVDLDAQHIEKSFSVMPGHSIAEAPEYQEILQLIEESGKVLLRWVDEETDKTYDINKPLSKGVSLYAVFAGEKYTVTYDIETNGGSGAGPVDSSKYASGAKAKAKKFTGTAPEGMEFKKWEGSDGRDYYPGEEISIKKSLTLTAVYAAATKKIDLTYYANFTNNGSEASKTVKVFEGQNVTIAANEFGAPEGHSFVEWNTKADGSGDAYAVGSKANITKDGTNKLYAQYKVNKYAYKVGYDFDGTAGSGDFADITGTADYGTAILEKSGAKTEKSVTYNEKNYVLENITNKDGKVTTNAAKNVVTINYSLDENENEVPDKYEAKVTYKVVNGAWNNEATADITKYVPLKKDGKYAEDGTYKLTSIDVPGAGEKPATGYKAGSWDVNPVDAIIGKAGATYTYTYVKDESQQKELSYKVEYYKDGNLADTDTVTGSVWVNDPDTLPVDENKINTTDKFGEGWSFTGTDPETIPNTIAKDGVIKVYYEIESYAYKVGYNFDGTAGSGDFADITGTADYGTAILETSGAKTEKSVTYNEKNYVLENITNKDGKVTTNAAKNVVTINYSLDENENEVPDKYEAKVTYKVVNGAWNDETTDDKTIYVPLKKDGEYAEDGTYTLTSNDVPGAGEKPATGYKAGSWDVNPVGQVISKNDIVNSGAVTIQSDIGPANQVESTSFVYAYAKDESQTKDLSYKVEYYRDGSVVDAETETVTESVWINDPDTLTVDKDKINTKDKFGEKWEFVGTNPDPIPEKIGNKEVIEVSYERSTIYSGYEVTYSFKSDTGEALPEEVNKYLPVDEGGYKLDDEVNAIQPAKTVVAVSGGKWTFKGYENEKIVISAEEETNKFVGIWAYTEVKDDPADKDDKDKKDNKNSKEDNEKSAKTGDETPIGAVGAMMLLSALGGVFALRRKED